MEKLLLPRKEAAQMLSISEDTLDRLRSGGHIKAVQIGVRIYFTPEELKAFITKEGPIDA